VLFFFPPYVAARPWPNPPRRAGFFCRIVLYMRQMWALASGIFLELHDYSQSYPSSPRHVWKLWCSPVPFPFLVDPYAPFVILPAPQRSSFSVIFSISLFFLRRLSQRRNDSPSVFFLSIPFFLDSSTRGGLVNPPLILFCFVFCWGWAGSSGL